MRFYRLTADAKDRDGTVLRAGAVFGMVDPSFALYQYHTMVRAGDIVSLADVELFFVSGYLERIAMALPLVEIPDAAALTILPSLCPQCRNPVPFHTAECPVPAWERGQWPDNPDIVGVRK